MSDDAWAICPFVDLVDMTLRAAEDILLQEGVGDVRLLLIANDCTDESLGQVEEWVAGSYQAANLRDGLPRVLLWNHRPALPALGATWNRALQFCWEAGAEWALCPNNDCRIHPKTYSLLLDALIAEDALFVSAVNAGGIPDPYEWSFTKGGPDYSCFLISRECHERFPFDPELTYCSDLSHHREIMLAGEGRRIFSVNVPYHHLASRTIAELPEEKARIYREQADAHRAYYQKKWGGQGVNAETFREPFSGIDEEGITTSQLFDKVRAGW